MMFSAKLCALTTMALAFQAAKASPVASNQTTPNGDFTPMATIASTDHGCSCFYWKSTSSDRWSTINVQCDTISAGVNVRGVWGPKAALSVAADSGATDWFSTTN